MHHAITTFSARFVVEWLASTSLIALTAARAEFVLVEQGRPVATIMTAAQPSDNAKTAAAELQKYVEKMSGVRLTIVDDTAQVSGPVVLVGPSRLTAQIPDLRIPAGKTRNLREEGFVVRTVGDRLVLAGNDVPPYFGTRYAVVYLLHELGVRWFMPGEIGEVVPSMNTIKIGPINVTQKPDFPMRNFWEHGRGKMVAELREWKIHNMLNPDSQDAFGVPADGSIGRYLPKDKFDTYPEWFALQRDGTRDSSHPCTTSEGMIEYVAERIKREARSGNKVSAFAPVDGNPRCWCENCERIGNAFDGYGANERDPIPESSASNEWFYFVNRILAKVNEEFPEHIIASNGYANRDIPPEVPPHIPFDASNNLTVMFANIGACTIHAYDDPKCWQMHRQAQMIRQWCKLSDKVWIYNYNYTMLVNKGTLTPVVQRIRRNIPLLKEWGVVGFYDQDEGDWALSGLPTRLVRARLQWDTKADVDAILEDFFTQWFGPAAQPMKAYYQALEDAFENTHVHGHEDVILPSIYTDELMAVLDRQITAAEAAVTSEPYRFRVGLERLIYDLLRAYVAMMKAQHNCEFRKAAEFAGRIIELQAELNKRTPFMGWHPFKVYESDWEQKRMLAADAKINGPVGKLIAPLPLEAAFRLDPHDDGRFERWQDGAADPSQWRTMRTTAGWDAQGLHDERGRPYKGIAWYQFEVDIPKNASVEHAHLHGMAIVNEAWVWVNGRYAGHRPYMMQWFRPHSLDMDVSKLLIPGQRNRITLRVLCNADVWGANGIYERLFLYDRNPEAPPEKSSRRK